MHFLQILWFLVLGYGCTVVTAVPTSTSSSERAIVSQIRTVQSPVYHYYLQDHDGVPQLGPEGSSDYFSIGNTILDTNTTLYLNVDRSVSTSYKKVTYSTEPTTSTFALEGDTITLQSPRQLNFLACATSDTEYYDVYLQDGNDSPPGSQCTLVTLHLPCLC